MDYLRLLGTIQVEQRGQPVRGFESCKALALLGYLAVQEHPFSRSHLADIFWPDKPEARGRANLSRVLHNLSTLLSGCFQADYQTIQFQRPALLWVDTAAFVELVRREEVAAWVEAASLYRGEFMEGLYLKDCPEFETWLVTERERWQRQVTTILEALVYHYIGGEQYGQAQHFTERLLVLELWRESAHQQMMWLLAQQGQREAALIQYETCCRVLAEELDIEPAAETKALYAYIRSGKIDELAPLLPGAGIALPRPKNPYKGLQRFHERDAADFFGRQAMTGRLVAAVQQRPLVAVVGSSGSGKSSLVLAGLLPHLRRETVTGPFEWLMATFCPGEHPFHTLATALLPLFEPKLSEASQLAESERLAEILRQDHRSLATMVRQLPEPDPAARRLLLVVDQFEELYTLCLDPETRQDFLDMLLAVTGEQLAVSSKQVAINSEQSGRNDLIAEHCSPITVVLTLRADFMEQVLAYRPLADAWQEAALVLGPMTCQELAQAIEKPARRQGVAFEPGLVARILDDVSDAPGNLPLIEFALTMLWERQAGGQLTHAAYETIGKVEGALTSYADKVYRELSRAEQKRARQVFIQMVQPGQRTEDTRRLTTRAELDEEGWVLTQKLANARLVVTNRSLAEPETAEIVHEALIRDWDRLQTWLNSDRAFRIWQEQLRAALRQWETSRRNEQALLHGIPLAVAAEWLAKREANLSQVEQTFIRASMALRERKEAEQAQRQAARRKFRRRVTWGLSASLVVAVILAVLTGLGWWRTEQEHQITLSNQLATQALNLLDEQQFDLALLLSLEALRTADTLAARSSLLTGLQRSPYHTILRHHSDSVSSVAFGPDGQTLVSGSGDGVIIFWDVDTGQPTGQPLTNPAGGVNSLALSPDGQTLAVGSANGSITLWNVNTRQLVGSAFNGHNDRVESIAFSPDGRILASGGVDRHIILWDTSAWQPLGKPLSGHRGRVKSIAFSPNGQILASGSVVDSRQGVDNLIMLWDVATQQLKLKMPTEERSNVNSLDFSPDGKTLASSSENGHIALWDVNTGQPAGDSFQYSFWEPERPAMPPDVIIAFSPDGKTLASGCVEGKVILWDVTTGQVKGEPLMGHTGQVNSLAFSSDGRTLASGSADNTIILWTIDQLLGRSLASHDSGIWCVTFSQDGRTLALGGDDGTIMLWNALTGQPIGHPLTGHTAGLNDLAFSPDGKILVSGSDDDTMILWDVKTGHSLNQPLTSHTDGVNSVAFSPDGQMLASGSRDSTIILWNVTTRQPIAPPLTGHTDGVWSVAFSPDGQVLASGSWDGRIILWDVSTHQPLRLPLTGHTAAVVSVDFSPDGQMLASGSRDKTIILWDVANRGLDANGELDVNLWSDGGDSSPGQPIGHPLSGHSGTVWSLAFSPDGQVLASGSCRQTGTYGNCNQGEIRLWDVASGRPIGQPLVGHTDVVWSVAFSPDGRMLASGSGDATTMLWNVDFELWQILACNIANRNLSNFEWKQYLDHEPYHKTCSALP